MTRILACSLLLLSTLAVCQSQNLKSSFTSAQASSDSGAQAQQPKQPVQALLQDNEAANEDIQSNLQSALDDDPILSEANVGTEVDDQSITLTGTVQSYWEHQRVLQLVAPYSSSRNIVDKLTVE